VNVPYHYVIDTLCILFIYAESIKLSAKVEIQWQSYMRFEVVMMVTT
jgi:hypothetical protein